MTNEDIDNATELCREYSAELHSMTFQDIAAQFFGNKDVFFTMAEMIATAVENEKSPDTVLTIFAYMVRAAYAAGRSSVLQ